MFMFALKRFMKMPWSTSPWGPVACVSLTSLFIGACGGGDASGITEEQNVNLNLYAPQNLPSSFTVEVPESLEQTDAEGDSGGGTGRVLARKAERLLHLREVGRTSSRTGKISGGATKAVAPPVRKNRVSFARRGIQTEDYGYTAMGYYELQNVISQMEWKKQDVAMNFLMADAIFDQVVDYCAMSGEDASSGCSIPADTLSMSFTQEMVNFILQSSGVSTDDPYYAEFAAMYESMIGMDMPVPALLYTTSVDGGYDHEITIDAGSWEDYQSNTSLKWDAARTKVQLVYEYGSPLWGAGSDSYTYNDSDKMVTYVNSGEYSGSSWTYSMTMQEDPAKADSNGILFTVRSEYRGTSDQYVMNLSGVADDNGGYVETTQTSTYTEITVTSGAGLLSDGGYYAIIPGTSCSGAGWENAVGTVSAYDYGTYDESWNYVPADGVISSDETYAYLWGSADVLSGSYVLCTYSSEWNEYEYTYTESFTEVAAAGSVVITAGDPVTDVWKYSEGFDADGSLTFSAYAQCDEFGVCDQYYYDFGADAVADSEYVDYYDDATSDGAIIDEIPVVSLTGDTSSVSADSYVVFTRDGMEIDDYWTNVIGYAYFNYWADCNEDYTVCNGQWETYYWGTADEVGSADAYLYEFSYDGAEGYSWSYTPTTAFSLSAQ